MNSRTAAVQVPKVGGDPKNFVHLGEDPGSSQTISADKSVATYFWVGVEVVKKRNIRADLESEDKMRFHKDPEKWDSPTYLVLKRTISMPQLGGTLSLDGRTAQRLLEQIPEGCLMTAQQGGAAVAEYIKEQIEDGVELPYLTRGKFVINKDGTGKASVVESAEEVVANMDEDELRKVLIARGMGHLVEPDTK